MTTSVAPPLGWSPAERQYCCYLSDLAVDLKYQKRRIGRELIRQTQSRLGDKAKRIIICGFRPTVSDHCLLGLSL